MKLFDLFNQSVVVVGGSSGMGRAIAAAAAECGARVVVTSRSADKAGQVATAMGTNVSGRAIDTTNEDAIRAFFADTGEIDHLVISASQVKTGPLTELPLADALATFQSKFFGPYLCAKHARVKPGGSITFFSGILSRRPGRNDAILAGVNAAVEAMGRALARDLAPTRVNTISPGLTRDTNAFEAMPASTREGMFAAVGAALPVGRVGLPLDIAHAAIFLMATPFVTGITLDVDGGGLLV
jgi:NAD(P)-dependent dehydrogenase (short-subunit alcohol dehydrogenase family)